MVILSVFCVIFCVSPDIDFFICSVFSVLFLVMVFICVVIFASISMRCLSNAVLNIVFNMSSVAWSSDMVVGGGVF